MSASWLLCACYCRVEEEGVAGLPYCDHYRYYYREGDRYRYYPWDR